MPDQNKNDIIPKFKGQQEQAFALMKDKYIEIGISIGYGLNNGKKIDSEEALNEILVREISQHQPKGIFILIGDKLQAKNYYKMTTYLTDEELKERLKDIPDDINEEKLAAIFAEKFADIAEKLGDDYIKNLEEHFNQCNIINELKALNIPLKIKRWDNRISTENYDSSIDNPPPAKDKMQKTKKNYLDNKIPLRKHEEERIKKAQPKLASIDFNILDNITCEQYISVEYDYFKNLHGVFVYPAKMPEVLDPICTGKSHLYWQSFEFKKCNLEKIQNEIKKQKSRTLAIRRAKFFAPLDPQNFHNDNPKTDIKEDIITKVNELSPRSSIAFRTFLNSYTQSPPGTGEKEKAFKMMQEANALLVPKA